MSEISEAVAFMDERLPGWRTLVDTGRLDMFDSSDCVLGQIFGNYTTGLVALKVPVRLTSQFCAYTPEWKQAVKPRADVTVTLNPKQADLLYELLFTHVSGKVSGDIGINRTLESAGAQCNYVLERDGMAIKRK